MGAIRDAAASKQRILEEAQKEFAQKGFSGGSVNTIAINARINKRMIYHYFGSKEELYKAVFLTNIQKLFALEEQAFHAHNDPIACITEMISRYYHFLWQNPDFVRLVSWDNLESLALFAETARSSFDFGLSHLHEFYREGLEKGLLQPDLPVDQVVLSVKNMCFTTFAQLPMLKAYWGGNLEQMLTERLAHICQFTLRAIVKDNIKEEFNHA